MYSGHGRDAHLQKKRSCGEANQEEKACDQIRQCIGEGLEEMIAKYPWKLHSWIRERSTLEKSAFKEHTTTTFQDAVQMLVQIYSLSTTSTA